jgi:hypothetical protein
MKRFITILALVSFSICLPIQVLALMFHAPADDTNYVWKIEIDDYGDSDTLYYKYRGVGDVNEFNHWKGYVRYKVNGIEHKKWLRDFRVVRRLPYIDPPIPLGTSVTSIIEDDYIKVNIETKIESFWWRGSYNNYKICQTRKFIPKQNNITDFRYYKYMDANIGVPDDYPDNVEGKGDDDYGFYGTIASSVFGENLPGFDVSTVWIVDGSAGYPMMRGFNLTCGGTQPDCFYYYYNIPDYRNRPGGMSVNAPEKIINDMTDEDGNLDDNQQFGPGDVAVALRWSKENLNGTFTVREVTHVVPEPCTMLLMGSGLAGLAGIARRRRRQQQ